MKQYQVNIVCKAENGDTVVTTAKTITAENINAAWNQATALHGGNDNIRVYPLATLFDGASVMELARYTLASVERWERCNDYAALEPLKRTPEDKEDFIQTAALAIWETLVENPDAPMYDAKRNAFAAVRREQQRRARNSEREYLPGWSTCNIAPRRARATTPELDRLVREAIAVADMTDTQAAIFDRFFDGMTAADIATELNISRATVYTHIKRAEFKILQAMDELDPRRAAFAAAGYSDSDIADTLDMLERRAK